MAWGLLWLPADQYNFSMAGVRKRNGCYFWTWTCIGSHFEADAETSQSRSWTIHWQFFYWRAVGKRTEKEDDSVWNHTTKSQIPSSSCCSYKAEKGQMYPSQKWKNCGAEMPRQERCSNVVHVSYWNLNILASQKVNRQGEQVQKPDCILIYNQNMCGVDCKDQLTSYYTLLQKSIKRKFERLCCTFWIWLWPILTSYITNLEANNHKHGL